MRGPDANGADREDLGSPTIRVPASSANLGAGFDVFGMALDLYADIGVGDAPSGARVLDEHHPATIAYVAAGGTGSLWARSALPMGRGLGYSGAMRVGGAALGYIDAVEDPHTELERRGDEVVALAAELEGHGDNAAASMVGGIVAWIDGRVRALRVGPNLAAAVVVVWIPDTTTSTDRSRAALSSDVDRADVVHNLGRAVQLTLAVEHDDPQLLVGAMSDRIHQSVRLAAIADADIALEVGVEHGAWCGWLSGSGPTVAFLCPGDAVASVLAALPASGHTKSLRIAPRGAHLIP